MSHSVPSRPLSLIPFFAADGVLLLTALLIAWSSAGELTGGALAGVVICTCLGGLLTVLPFVLNDAREREAALAARQRELVDLVEATTATASRWGAQWTAAATGLEDASNLAARSIAAADRVPAALQEKIDALGTLLAESASNARERSASAAQRDEALAVRSLEISGVLEALNRTALEFNRVDAALRERHAALTASLAEVPSAVARVQSVHDEIEAKLTQAPGRIAAHLDRAATEAEARLSTTGAAIAARVAELETMLASLTAQLERVRSLELPAAPAAVPVPMPAPAPETIAEPAKVEPLEAPAGALASTVLPVETGDPAEAAANGASREQPVLAVSITPDAVPPAAKRVNVICKDAIMDPFYIPDNGYSALADAMDGQRT